LQALLCSIHMPRRASSRRPSLLMQVATPHQALGWPSIKVE
jgi:hypothetical protein